MYGLVALLCCTVLASRPRSEMRLDTAGNTDNDLT